MVGKVGGFGEMKDVMSGDGRLREEHRPACS